jgi:hypothetical protein
VAPDASVSPDTASASSSPDTGFASASPDSSLSSDDQKAIIRVIKSNLNNLRNKKSMAEKKKNNQVEIDFLTNAIAKKEDELATKQALHDSRSRPEHATKRFFARRSRNTAQVAPSGGKRTRKHKKSRTRRKHKKSRKY